MKKVFHIFKGLAAVVAVFALLLSQEANGAVILDWTDWTDFEDGDDGRQRFTNADGVEIEYRPRDQNSNGNPRPELIFGTPAIQSGGAGEVLMVAQSAEPGDGTLHEFSIRDNESIDGAMLTIGDIDGSTLGLNNYVDEFVFVAELADGSEVAPTRIYVSNDTDVTQIGADRVAAVPNTGSAGSVQVFFDYAEIERLEIYFYNSETGTFENFADNQGFWLGDIVETGLTSVPVPEPAALTLGLLGGALALRRRRPVGN